MKFVVSSVIFIRLAHLVWEPSVLVAASVCHLSVLRQISETMWDTRKILSSYKKSGSESKNIMSDFASEVAKYPQNPQNPPKPQTAQNEDLYN